MLRYLAHRFLVMIPTLLAISFIVFFVVHLPPGNFLETMIAELQSQGEKVDPAKIEFLRQQYGLDQPFIQRYFLWVINLLQGDFGVSWEYDKPVWSIVSERLFLTFIVCLGTIIFTWIVAFPIGVYSATHQYSWSDHGLTFVGFLGLATPNFLFALVIAYLANAWLGIEIGGLMDEKYIDAPWTWGKIGNMLQHLWIPVIVIGTAGTAGMIRRLRANLLDELQKQYVVTARAKGLPPLKLLTKYPLRMALNPFISDIGDILPDLVSGAVIVSIVLNLPTTGKLLYDSLVNLDTYLAASFLLFLALLTVIGVLISDLALAALDPRIRLQGKAAK
ncbi:MAG: ABC transporter permease [Alphaproteobacteria bacterium]